MNRKFDLTASREDAPATAAGRSNSGVVESAPSARRTPSSAGAWDPYEVWLTRVKQPRDRRYGPINST